MADCSYPCQTSPTQWHKKSLLSALDLQSAELALDPSWGEDPDPKLLFAHCRVT